MNARVLGYLLMYMPSSAPSGAAKLAGEIMDCEDEAALDTLAKHIIDNFVRVFRTGRMGRTPVHSDHPSRPSFDRDWANNLAEVREAPVDHADAKRKALVRDNYRCMVSGRVDLNCAILGLTETDDNTAAAHTHVAHIFPQTLGTGHEKIAKKEWVVTVWTVMERFGNISPAFQRDLHGPKIHALDELIPNGYRLGAFPERVLTLLGLPNSIVFKSSDPHLPLPNPRYLELHAAAAKVAHLSGTADYIEKTLRDLGDNGSSAELLKSATADI
ncbi:hypothetical protein BS47DRAFT_1345048, partial [Hydnum rufescens UP504]